MNRKKVLLIRPPRYLWPFINESDNFLLPLGLPCIAAMIRQHMPEVDIKIVDCPPLKIGWQSLRRIIEEEKPDVVGAGEEALYHHEAVKVFALAKSLNPQVITIGAGHFFSWMVNHSLDNYPIDYIVRFEGELTIIDLLQALFYGKDISQVLGIAYRANGQVQTTDPRPLIANLDDLPIAAYDLMPMGKYSPFGYLWPVSATIEHSRGCVDTCKFCSLWTFWGRQKETDVEKGRLDVTPSYRTKSVERSMEEIDLLYNKYGRRYLIWADPTFNVDPKWTDEFCEQLLSRNYKDLHWWAFLRADFALRDEQNGTLEKMVRAGMVHPLIGIERSCTEDLHQLNKHAYTRDLVKDVFHIFKSKYPHVFRQGTFVTCLPSDTRESMLDLVKYAVEIDIDYPAFHPLAPVPGTHSYQDMLKDDQLAITDFKKYDWATPVTKSEQGLSLEELAALNVELNKRYVLRRPHWLIRGLFSKYKHKRNLYWWFFINTLKIIGLEIKSSILGKDKMEGISGFMRLKKPAWYDD